MNSASKMASMPRRNLRDVNCVNFNLDESGDEYLGDEDGDLEWIDDDNEFEEDSDEEEEGQEVSDSETPMSSSAHLAPSPPVQQTVSQNQPTSSQSSSGKLFEGLLVVLATAKCT